MSSTQKYIIIGASCVFAAGALWYLSKDPNETSFDPQKHTIEELRGIIKEIFYDSATHLTHKLTMILNLKKSDELTDNLLQNMQSQYQSELEMIEKEICEEKGYSQFFLEDWVKRFENDPLIKKYFEELK